MATRSWSLGDLKMISPRYRSVSGAEIFSFTVWSGSLYLRINLDKTPKPIFNRKWKSNEVFAIAKFMTDFCKDSSSDKTLLFNTYNAAEKKRDLDYVFIMHRDEHHVFHFVIKTNNQTYDFPLKGMTNVSYGSGDIPDEEKSMLEWLYLTDFLKNRVPTQMQLTNVPLQDDPNNVPSASPYSNHTYNSRPQNNTKYRSSSDFQVKQQNINKLPPDDDIFE